MKHRTMETAVKHAERLTDKTGKAHVVWTFQRVTRLRDLRRHRGARWYTVDRNLKGAEHYADYPGHRKHEPYARSRKRPVLIVMPKAWIRLGLSPGAWGERWCSALKGESK